jgi:hypothetical protein
MGCSQGIAKLDAGYFPGYCGSRECRETCKTIEGSTFSQTLWSQICRKSSALVWCY